MYALIALFAGNATVLAQKLNNAKSRSMSKAMSKMFVSTFVTRNSRFMIYPGVVHFTSYKSMCR